MLQVRRAARHEISQSGVPQSAVAAQSAIALAVFFPYLSGGKGVGRRARAATRSKLLGWLAKRGVVPKLPEKGSASRGVGDRGTDRGADPAPFSPAAGSACASGGASTPSAAPSTGKSKAAGACASANGKAAAGGSASGGGSKGASSSKSGNAKGGEGSSKNPKGGGAGASAPGKNIKLTPQHLHVAYVWYIKQRDAQVC
jgi:hypothetical protein